MDIKKQISRRALTLTTILTLFVAGFEIFFAFMLYKPGMNFLDVTSYVTSNKYVYFMLLIVANMALLPSAILLYKENGISLKDEIYEKKTLKRDILIGVTALIVTELISLLFSLTYKGRTSMAFQEAKPDLEFAILCFIALGLVSGIVKEIFFRGLAKRFCGPVLGENMALLLFNVMFSMLDWHNYGYSFVIGLVWIWAYKKSNHLIAPMIAHAGSGIIIIFYYLLVN
jgi:membrane protease YdiL (CAAX protease family)